MLRCLIGLPDVEVVAAADSADAVLTRKRESYPDIKYVKSLDELLAIPSDAVVIATPPDKHYPMTMASLAAGKDVFVEKPMAVEVAHAEQMRQKAIDEKRILMVGHIMEYHPAVRWLKKYIDSGELGDVLYLYATRVNLGRVRSFENALWSFAPHDISIMGYLLQRSVTRVSCNGASYLQEGIEDVAFLSTYFDGGIIGHIHISWLDPHKVRKLTVVGTKKMVVVDDMARSNKITIYDKGVDRKFDFENYGEYLSIRNGDIVLPAVKNDEPLKKECLAFIEAIRTRTPPVSDADDGLMVTRVLSAAQLSMKQWGKPINME